MARATDGYKQRLKDWILEESEKKGGIPALAIAITVQAGDSITSDALHNWVKGNFVRGLTDESLEKIAAYKGLTKDQVRHWLEGGDEAADSPPKSLAEQMRTAPIEEVAEAVFIGVARLNYWVQLYQFTPSWSIVNNERLLLKGASTMTEKPIVILLKTVVASLTPPTAEKFREYTGGYDSPQDLERLRFMIDGLHPIDEDDVSRLSFAIKEITNNEIYSPQYIRDVVDEVIKNPHLPTKKSEDLNGANGIKG